MTLWGIDVLHTSEPNDARNWFSTSRVRLSPRDIVRTRPEPKVRVVHVLHDLGNRGLQFDDSRQGEDARVNRAPYLLNIAKHIDVDQGSLGARIHDDDIVRFVDAAHCQAKTSLPANLRCKG